MPPYRLSASRSTLTLTEVAPAVPAPLADARLVQRLRAGDEPAFEELVRSHGPRMFAVARRYLRCEADAEEVLQEAFLNVARRIGTFEGHSKLSTWLHRVVVNCALMRLRSRAGRPEVLAAPEFALSREEAATARSTAHGEPLGSPERADLIDAVHAALAQLPDVDRAVLRLRELQGVTLEEISRLLAMGLTTVKDRLRRARQTVRALVAPLLRQNDRPRILHRSQQPLRATRPWGTPSRPASRAASPERPPRSS